MWELYCDDKLLGTVDRLEKAERWLSNMQAVDTDQEFTWSITRRTDGQRVGDKDG